jgi:hypothetical protein
MITRRGHPGLIGHDQRCENIFIGRALNQSPDLVVMVKADEPDAQSNAGRVNLANG